MPRYGFDVDVVYSGVVEVSADSPDEAESIVRQAVKPQGVFYETLLDGDAGYDFDMHPTVRFRNMKEIPK